MAIGLIGGILGAVLTYPGSMIFQAELRSFLPVFEVTGSTIALILVVSLLVGFAAALPPVIRVTRMGIVQGLGHMG